MTFTFPHRLGSFPLFAQMADGTVTTLHGRQDCPDLKPLYIGFSEMPLVSISNDQRRPIAKANFAGTVHQGIPTNLHTPIYSPRGTTNTATIHLSHSIQIIGTRCAATIACG
jgi:hypothetical protein